MTAKRVIVIESEDDEELVSPVNGCRDAPISLLSPIRPANKMMTPSIPSSPSSSPKKKVRLDPLNARRTLDDFLSRKSLAAFPARRTFSRPPLKKGSPLPLSVRSIEESVSSAGPPPPRINSKKKSQTRTHFGISTLHQYLSKKSDPSPSGRSSPDAKDDLPRTEASSSSHIAAALPPLVNHGLDCYINTALIKFLSIPAVRHALESISEALSLDLEPPPHAALCKAMLCFLSQTSQLPFDAKTIIAILNSARGGSVSVSQVAGMASAAPLMFPANTQGDPIEVEEFLMSALSRSLPDYGSTPARVTSIEDEIQFRQAYSQIFSSKFDTRFYEEKKCSATGCPGLKIAFSVRHRTELILAQPTSSEPITLQSLFQDISLPFDAQVKCESCNSGIASESQHINTVHRSFDAISALPEVLQVQFKRFILVSSAETSSDAAAAKVCLPVLIPSRLNITTRAPAPIPIQSMCYIVTAIGCHQGATLSEGHHYCWVRTAAGWIRYDDGFVSSPQTFPSIDPEIPYSLTLSRADTLPESWMEADIYLTRTESESDTNSLFRDSLSAEDSPQIHPIDPADDINLDELDLAAEADGGDSTGSTLLKSKIAARLKGWKSLVEDFLYDAIDIRSTLKTSPNHLASDKQLAVLLTFINTVRRGRASLRYPLDMRSSEFTHIRHKPSVIRVLTAIAWHGKEFEPSQFPEQLIRQTHDDYITYKVSHSSGTDHKKGSGPVVFSHYTRCTPLRTIEELVKQLNVLAIKYPVDYPWVQAQLHDLKTLQDAGQSKARIFYHGATIKSGIVREVQDSQGSDHYSLLKHWKAVTNDHLEVYQWKDLQIQADNYFKWRTDPALSGIEDVLVDVAGGPALTFNQHPGGFIFRIKPHPLLEKARAEFNAVKAKGIPPFPPTTSLTRVDDEERSLRQSRIANCLKELSLFAQRYPKDFTSQHIARKDRLDAITKIASDFSVEGNNTIRAVVRDAIPLEVLLHPAKAYSDAEVGRGARNDYMVDEEAQGLVNPDTGAVTGEYRSTLFPMLDLFSVTIDHPNKWLPLFIAVLSTWLHILKPRYVSVCSSQIHKLALGGHFSSVFIEDKDLVKSALDSAFVDEKKPIDEDFLAGTIRHFLPWKNDTDISAPDSHPQKIVWPKLDTVDYIDWVGVVQVLPFGIDYRIVIPTYHGGSHAYIGCLRPHTIRLAQACEAVKALVEWATEGLHVDGTLAQANNIKHTIDKIAEKIGLDKVLESIRKDVKIRTRPLHSLKQLGSLNRAEPEQRQERAVRASSLMKQSITNYNQSTLKAVGRPGTAERLKQAMALLDINRQAINNGNTQVLPCPSNIAAGPGSCDFLEWMTFSVQEGKSYARTAQGASRLPTNAVKLEAVMTNQSVQRQREARARFADADSGTISVGDAKKELEKRKPVLLIKCSYCEMVAITKSEKAFKDRVRHACPNHKKELHDIDADQRKADGLKAVLEDPGPPSRSFDRPSHKQKLVQWSSDGKGGMWQTCADDQSVQAFSNTILNVSSSSKNKQRIQTLKPVRDRREKHGRLLLEDLIVLEKIRSYVRLKTILTQRSEANLPVPSSFTVVDVNTQI